MSFRKSMILVSLDWIRSDLYNSEVKIQKPILRYDRFSSAILKHSVVLKKNSIVFVNGGETIWQRQPVSFVVYSIKYMPVSPYFWQEMDRGKIHFVPP